MWNQERQKSPEGEQHTRRDHFPSFHHQSHHTGLVVDSETFGSLPGAVMVAGAALGDLPPPHPLPRPSPFHSPSFGWIPRSRLDPGAVRRL